MADKGTCLEAKYPRVLEGGDGLDGWLRGAWALDPKLGGAPIPAGGLGTSYVKSLSLSFTIYKKRAIEISIHLPGML